MSARIINVNAEGYKWRLDGCRDDGVLPGDATDLKTAGGASVFDLLFSITFFFFFNWISNSEKKWIKDECRGCGHIRP